MRSARAELEYLLEILHVNMRDRCDFRPGHGPVVSGAYVSRVD